MSYFRFKRHVKYDQSYIAPTKTLEQLNAPIAPEDERRFKNIKAAAIDDNGDGDEADCHKHDNDAVDKMPVNDFVTADNDDDRKI